MNVQFLKNVKKDVAVVQKQTDIIYNELTQERAGTRHCPYGCTVIWYVSLSNQILLLRICR